MANRFEVLLYGGRLGEFMDDELKPYLREQWLDLGFFYKRDVVAKEMRIVGSRAGLAAFARLLREYAEDSRNAMQSEHEHYGPYGDLKVMTWPDASMDRRSICGTLQDLKRLAELIDERVAALQPGALARIREEYSATSECGLVLDVREDGFDPASLDGNLTTTTR